MTGREVSAPQLSEPVYTRGYRGTILALLLLVYTFNFIDRTIIATLGQAIKVDLHITDAQLGLLQGFAFALFYTTLGLPLARLSERYDRVTIISVCLALWSAMTALCASAQTFLQLFLYRVGVGVGEAGCSPPAHSIITDLYSARARATALAVYSFGIPLGTMFGAVSGGLLAEHLSWRVAFVVVGLPGVALALIVRLMVRDPPRGMSEDAPGTLSPDPPPIMTVARRLFGTRCFAHIAAGATLTSFVGYGTGTFVQPYFVRMFGLTYAEVGLVFGLLNGISAGAGTILGGMLADTAGRRGAHWYALVPAIGVLLAAPLYALAFTRDTWFLAAGLLLLPGIFHYSYIGPTLGVMHNLIGPRMRATATALFFLVLNLIALGIGPYFTGLLIDHYSERQFLERGLVDFAASCPGGQAPPGAIAELAQACRESLGLGTRQGIVLTLLLLVWAAWHYAWAARSIRRDLEASQAAKLQRA
jgi:predicted MFS family arabinose efflux permease